MTQTKHPLHLHQPFELTKIDTINGFGARPKALLNNGHAIQLSYDKDQPLLLEPGEGDLNADYGYSCPNMHIHATTVNGSEHSINFQKFFGELHIMCFSRSYRNFNQARDAAANQNPDKRDPYALAVLAFFINIINLEHTGKFWPLSIAFSSLPPFSNASMF